MTLQPPARQVTHYLLAPVQSHLYRPGFVRRRDDCDGWHPPERLAALFPAAAQESRQQRRAEAREVRLRGKAAAQELWLKRKAETREARLKRRAEARAARLERIAEAEQRRLERRQSKNVTAPGEAAPTACRRCGECDVCITGSGRACLKASSPLSPKFQDPKP